MLFAKRRLGQGEKGCLADSAGDHDQMRFRFQIPGFRFETVTEGSPDVEPLAGLKLVELARELAFDEINNIDGEVHAITGKHRVIERERPAQKWIARAGQTDHEELTRTDRCCQVRRDESDAKRVACQANIGADRDGLLEKTWIHVGLAESPKSRQKNQPRMARKTPIRANKNSAVFR